MDDVFGSGLMVNGRSKDYLASLEARSDLFVLLITDMTCSY